MSATAVKKIHFIEPACNKTSLTRDLDAKHAQLARQTAFMHGMLSRLTDSTANIDLDRRPWSLRAQTARSIPNNMLNQNPATVYVVTDECCKHDCEVLRECVGDGNTLYPSYEPIAVHTVRS